MKSIDWTPRDFGWKAELERQLVAIGMSVVAGLVAFVVVVIG